MSPTASDPRDRSDRDLASLLARSLGPDARPEELALQWRALELVSGTGRVLAPSALHHQVNLLVRQGTKRRSTTLWALLGGGPALACVIAATLVIMLLPSGGTGFTLGEAVALTRSSIMYPAPLESVEQGAASRSEWMPGGVSEEHISGRLVTTTFYTRRGGGSVEYAIVGGPPFKVRGWTRSSYRGFVYYRKSLDGRELNAWVQAGHTHVLSGDLAPATVLTFAKLKIE